MLAASISKDNGIGLSSLIGRARGRGPDVDTLSLSGDRANPNDPEVPGGEVQHSFCFPTAAFLN